MKLARVLNGGLLAFTVAPPPGHEEGFDWRFRHLYVDEDSGQLHLLPDARRDELDPRWAQTRD